MATGLMFEPSQATCDAAGRSLSWSNALPAIGLPGKSPHLNWQ